jgi:hypothetical protein
MQIPRQSPMDSEQLDVVQDQARDPVCGGYVGCHSIVLDTSSASLHGRGVSLRIP